MKIVTGVYKDAHFQWDTEKDEQKLLDSAHLAMVFGDRMAICDSALLLQLQSCCKNAQIVMCSTSGEIHQHYILDGGAIVVLWIMENTIIKTVQANQADYSSDFEMGKSLIEQLPLYDLAWVVAFSDGSVVNGSDWVDGLNEKLPNGIVLSGGLAGDGLRFEATSVGLNALPKHGNTVAVGFYGGHFKVQSVALGGFQSFGRKRCITLSKNNIIYQIDHQPAIEVYKTYLGKYADELPGAALKFPMALYQYDQTEIPLVRTILSINPEDGSIVFAGNMPEGGWVRLMHANKDDLIFAAESAAKKLSERATNPIDFIFVVSCVGRKIVLGPRCVEEVEAIQKVFNDTTTVAGFYSHGEVATQPESNRSSLLNQTFTLTGISELPYGDS